MLAQLAALLLVSCMKCEQNIKEFDTRVGSPGVFSSKLACPQILVMKQSDQQQVSLNCLIF